MNAPEHLATVAQAKWQELQDQVNVTQPGVADALTAYAVAFSQWKAAQAKVDELGTVVKSPAGFPTISPYVTVAAQAERRMRQWGAALGIVGKTTKRKKKAATPEAVPDEPDLDAQLRTAELLAALEAEDAPAPPRRKRRAS